MRNHCLVALAVALMVGFTVAEAQARPRGGRGGGQRAGSVLPSNVRPGNVTPKNIRPNGQLTQPGSRNLGDRLQSATGSNLADKWNNRNFQNKVSQLNTHFTPANQPFTPAWYANHPNAWRYTHPNADVWAIATLGVAAAWLGIDAAAAGGYAADSGTVYTGETAEDGTTDDEQSASDDQSQNDANDANNTPGDFLPLGVFALAPKSEKDASALVQLAVNKQGTLQGNYYDVLTGQDQTVSGTLDKKTQRATFSVTPNGAVSFETTLASLTRPTGTVTLKFQNGQTRQWTLARFDAPGPAAPDTKQ